MENDEFLSQIDQVGELLSLIPTERLSDEILICECFSVSVRDIREACQSIQKVDLELLAKNFCLGQGCQSCLKTAESWINKIF